jgi:hypothetical protein
MENMVERESVEGITETQAGLFSHCVLTYRIETHINTIQTRAKTSRKDRKPTRNTHTIIFKSWEICNCIVALTPYKSVVGCLTYLSLTELGCNKGLGSNVWIFKVQYVEYGGELYTDEPQNFVRLSE